MLKAFSQGSVGSRSPWICVKSPASSLPVVMVVWIGGGPLSRSFSVSVVLMAVVATEAVRVL
jgi:hypothetical protein